MIKWFAYIVLLLVAAPCLSSATNKKIPVPVTRQLHITYQAIQHPALADTTPKQKQLKQQELDNKNHIKEVAKAKRQSKPEKVDDQPANQPNAKPARQRRPAGMERPPEIPRRNGN